jgi:uncharacterized protein
MRVDQIWTYPVKCLRGSRVPSADIDESGIVGDRLWTLRDEKRGAIASGRRVAGLNRLGATYAGDEVSITFPDGSTSSSADADVDARVSDAVGHPVTLWRRPAASELWFWAQGRSDSTNMKGEMQAIFGRTDDEPLPDFSVFPAAMREYEYPPGTLYDCFPLMLMSTSAVRSLREALPDSAIDERRFRPSMVVDTGDAEGHPEFDWTGRRLAVGAAVLQIGAACPRCNAVTHEFADDLPVDRKLLRHIVRDLDQNVGVYATVLTGGSVQVGDAVALL